MKYDYIIVGAGLSGSVLARILATDTSKSILIIDKREHIAGNCYDFVEKNGVFAHKYGPHIFHTNNEQAWKFLSKFTNWINYEHKVLAIIEDKYVPVPFNLTSISKLFSNNTANELKEKLIKKYACETKIPILKLQNENDEQLKMLADFVYRNIFLNYTIKQWNMKPEELDQSVTARIPVFISEDNRYFQDKFQGIPKIGYTKLVENILNCPNITLELNTEYNAIKQKHTCDTLFWTGMIDEFYNYKFGKLPYRSLRFEFESIQNNLPFQPVAQVNYTVSQNYTRITEFAHFKNDANVFKNIDFSTIAKEYSLEFNHAKNEIPYYPIPHEKNTKLYQLYRNLKPENNVIFLGRLADYSYYNMDQTVINALNIGNKYLN